ASRIMFFLFMAIPPTYIYTLSLHDALPISSLNVQDMLDVPKKGSEFLGVLAEIMSKEALRPPQHPERVVLDRFANSILSGADPRSEEHTSELQSQSNLVCRLLLEKKKHIHT